MLSFLLLSNIIFSKQQTFPRASCHARRRLSSWGRGDSKNIPGQLLYFCLFNKGSEMPRNDKWHARRYASIHLFWDIAKKKHKLSFYAANKQMHFIQKENMHKLQFNHIYWIHSLMCVREVMWLCTMGWCNWTNQWTGLVARHLKCCFWNAWVKVVWYNYLYDRSYTPAFQTRHLPHKARPI